MEELSFKEIRKQYYKKEKKWLSSDDQNLMKRLTGFQIAEETGIIILWHRTKSRNAKRL